MLCPKPANEPEPLELDPERELLDEPVELEELEEELEEDADELELLDELAELLEETDELLEEPVLLPEEEPELDVPGPVRIESAPHPGKGTTPASKAPPERTRRKSRRASRDDCVGRRRALIMIAHSASGLPGVAMMRVTQVTGVVEKRWRASAISSARHATDIQVSGGEDDPDARCTSCGAPLEQSLTACFSCGHPRRSPPPKKGQVISDRYELRGVLGRGGMGTVYRAHDRSLDEEVALKVLSEGAEDREDAGRRFRAEIRLARRVRHRNVCAIHEYGQLQDMQYIVMELVSGQDLKQYLESRGRLPASEALEIAREIGRGLQAIHDAGVIHRDLKPANVMRGLDGRLRLMDFGIAKRAGDMMSTVTGHIVGTPEYMSPEQVQGRPVDIRADIYSFAVMLYELLTGRVPFKADTPLAVIMMHVNEAPRLDDPAIPPAVGRVLGRALAKAPEDRYDSAKEFVASLVASVATDTPSVSSASPPSSGPEAGEAGPAWRAKRRDPGPEGITRQPGKNRWLTRASPAGVALLGLIAVAWFAGRASGPSPATTHTETTPNARTPAPAAFSETPSPTTNPSPAAPGPRPSLPASLAAVRPSALPTPSPEDRPRSPEARPDPTSLPAATRAPAPSIAPPSSPVPSPDQSPTAQAPAAVQAGGLVGYLQIGATPFAQVFVDEKDQGVISGSRRLEAGAGRHVIRFLHRDYRPLQRIVTVRAGEVTPVFVDLSLDGIPK